MKGKRLLALFLAASVFMTNGSIAFAAESDTEINYQEAIAYGASGTEQTEGDFTYVVEENGQATITKYNGTSTTVTIPEMVEGTIPVTALDDGIFYGNMVIEKITIPKTIKNIIGPWNLFYNTPSLNEIIVDSENTAYFSRDGVLYQYGTGSDELPMLIRYPEAKTTNPNTYVIPNDINEICSSAFYSCSVEKIIVPSSISWIMDISFSHLTNRTIILQQTDPSKIHLANRAFSLLTNCTIIVKNQAMKDAVQRTTPGSVPMFDCTNTVVKTIDELTNDEKDSFLTPAESLTFTDGTTEKSITLHPGENYPLNAAYRMEPADATENVTWTNTDDTIAHLVNDGSNGGTTQGSINRGCIEASGQVNYALTTGTTTFTGKDESGHTLTLHVTVDAPVKYMAFATRCDQLNYRYGYLSSFNVDENLYTENGKILNAKAEHGEEYYFYADINPGCNLSIPLSGNLKVESSSEDVAIISWINKDEWSNVTNTWIDENSRNKEYESYRCKFKLSALSPGTTTITATLDDNGTIWTDSFELTVTEPEQESDPAPTTPAPGQTPSVPVTPTPDTPAPVVPTPPAAPGTATQTKPAKMKTPTVKAGKKKLTVSWKKVKNADGYRIQYSTNSRFKKAKSLNCSKKTSKATIKKLKSGKKYYIRIRAYKKVNGRKYYGNWSKLKSVKVK